MKPKSEIYNIDCMEYMKSLPDNYFSLAIADPPYGIGANRMTLGNGHRKVYRGSDDWDNTAPTEEWFKELIRVSRNQIIFGANHFISKMPFDSSAWIVWDKGTGNNSFADCELAWTSFNKPVRKFFKSWVGNNAKEKTDIDRIHPTQKPVELYAWILNTYASKGDTIFDPMMGSASSRIAAYKLGFDYVGCEIDKQYFEVADIRFRKECEGEISDKKGRIITQLALF